ncbi:putative leucine-rich repeat-containing protein DDB_G0290503 [Chrysoperla carnea]|uniref:putative leucine-rich repeat-containing protein DDB_G0290503 n=1 Tax=Chrysoperla carnea TaxID=189513 RepID=UPI001D05FFDC|nr:putative leucine-rich repeat-containing protein DDB_G0290503 [Chrysoperla carnea]
MVTLHDLTKRTNEQDQIISELRNQICDYQHLENYIQKIANVNNQIESKNYDCNEAIEQVSSDSKGDTISLFSDLLNYNENDLKSIKCSSSIMSLQSIVVRLEMSQKTFENLQKRLNDCKCDEYYKEIQRLQDENMNLRKITDNGILTRETFLKLYDELSNEMAETKTYLQYLQDLLKHDTYTDDLEAKNCTLSSTILEMEKCIECLKLELAEFTNKANTDETTSTQCIENLETLLKEKELEVNCVRTQLLTKECNITRLETVNKSLTDKITQLQERLETVNNDLTDKITQMQKLEACNQELMDKITQLQDHCTKTYEKQCIYENLIDKTVSEMCDCKQTYETIQEKAEWLRQCLTHKFSEISEMQKNSQVCNETISLLRKQLSEEKQKYYEDMEKVSSTVTKLECRIENELLRNRRLESGISFIRKELEHRQQIEQQLLEKLRNQQKSIQKLESLQCVEKELHDNRECAQKLAEDNSMLKETVNNLREWAVKLQNNFNERCSCLEDDKRVCVEKLTDENSNLKKTIDDLKEGYMKLQDEYNQKYSSLEDENRVCTKNLTEENVKLKETIKAHIEKMAILEDEFNKKCACLEDDNRECINSLNEENLNMKETIKELKERIVNLQEECNNKCRCLEDNFNKKCTCLENELQNASKKIIDKDLLIHNLRTQLNIIDTENKIEIENHQRNLKEKEQLIKDLKATLARKFDEYSTTMNDLCEAIAHKENQIKDSSAKHASVLMEMEAKYHNMEVIKRQLKLDKMNNKYINIISEIHRNYDVIESKSQHELNDLDSILKHLQNKLCDKEKLLKSNTEELFLLRLQLNERNLIIEQYKREQLLLKNELESALNELVQYEEKLNAKNKIVENLQQTVDLTKNNLIKELQSINNTSNAYYQSINNELVDLKLHLNEKDKIIEQLILSHYHADNELMTQCQYVVNQCKNQINENEKCIENLQKTLAYKEQQLGISNTPNFCPNLANEITEKKQLQDELQAKSEILAKFVGTTEDQCKSRENEWMLKFQQLQSTNYELERKINHVESTNSLQLNTINNLQNQLKDLRDELNNNQQLIETLKNSYENDLNKFLKQHKIEVNDYNKRLFEKIKESEEIKLSFDKLLKKFERLQQANLDEKSVSQTTEVGPCCLTREEKLSLNEIQDLKIELTRLMRVYSLMNNGLESYRSHVNYQNALISQLQDHIKEFAELYENQNTTQNVRKDYTKSYLNIVETLKQSRSQLFEIDDEIKRMASEPFKWDCKDDLKDKDKCIQQLEEEKAELMEALGKSNKTSSFYIELQKNFEMELNKCNTALEEKDKMIKDFQETLKCQQCKMNKIQDQNVTLTNQIKEREHLLKSYELDMKSIKDLTNQNDNEIQHYRHQVIERDERIKELSQTISNYKNISLDVNYLQNELLEKDRIIKELEDELQIRNNPCTQTNGRLSYEIKEKEHVIETIKKRFQHEYQEIMNDFNENLRRIDTYDEPFFDRYMKLVQDYNRKINELEKIVRLKDALEEQKIVIQDLHTQLNNVNNKSEHDIQHRIECETKYFNDIMDLKRSNCDLHSKINELNLKNESLKTANRVLKKKYNDMENKYRIQHEKVIRDVSVNEKLKNHLTKFINTYGKSETQLQQSQSASQLDVCLKIISELRNEKSALEADNIALTEEISRLNTELYERCQENTSKQQKIDNLEKEMIELDKSRNELRAESKQVLENVRNWIQEQRQMNSILNENMSQKCAALERFKKERLNLLNDIDMLKQTNRQLISENSLLKRKLCQCGPPPALKLQHEFDESPCKMFNSSISSLDTTSISTSENQSIICIPPHSHPHCHDPNLKFM